jgi:hypothetical protein
VLALLTGENWLGTEPDRDRKRQKNIKSPATSDQFVARTNDTGDQFFAVIVDIGKESKV